jgi:Sulfotransferase family
MMISMHIPKTAGTSFASHLIAIHGEDICFDYGSQYGFVDIYPPTLAMRAFRLANHWRDRVRFRMQLKPTDRCIHGHFQAQKYRPQFANARFVTWLRDPVERVISQYLHWQRRPDRGHTISRLLHERQLTLVQFAELDVVRNLQSRYFGDMRLDDFWFVGVQERYDDELAAFYAKLDLAPRPIHARNVNPEKQTGKGYDVSPADRARLEALNELDRRLYDCALDRAARERGRRPRLVAAS